MTGAADLEALAERVLVLNALRSRVTELEAEAKHALAQAIPPGSSVKPLLAGRPVGTVSRSVTTTRATVSDPAAWAQWIERHYPIHSVITLGVRDAITALVLATSKDAGIPVGPGGECGESGPAGITVTESPGVVSARPDKARTAELWARIRERLPELNGSDSADPAQ